jgi:hypothetical protein
MMKWSLLLLSLSISTGAFAQVWKTLPKGVRILGYRNVTTSKVNSNFNQFGSSSPLGSSFRVDAGTLSAASGGAFNPNDFNSDAYNKFVVGDYKVDAEAQFNVQGTGFGIGLTENVMFYAEVAYYSAQVNSNIKRTSGNSYEQTARALEMAGGDVNAGTAETLRSFIDADESTIQSFITNHYKYKPIGNWTGTGYGDMETGAMIKMVDRGVWGVMLYPGVILPTVPAGARILVMNTSGTALNVYPPSGAAINSAATNAAYAQPAGARLEFVSVSATQWYTLNATYG